MEMRFESGNSPGLLAWKTMKRLTQFVESEGYFDSVRDADQVNYRFFILEAVPLIQLFSEKVGRKFCTRPLQPYMKP